MDDHRQNDEKILAQVEHLEGRFDDHMAIYAKNGKESARVAAVLERLEAHSHERDAKVDEMFNTYQSFKFGKVGIAWLFGLFVAVGSAILLIKDIFK